MSLLGGSTHVTPRQRLPWDRQGQLHLVVVLVAAARHLVARDDTFYALVC